MNYETVSYLKQNAASLPLSEPLTITQNGKPVYVVMSPSAWVEQQEVRKLLSMAWDAIQEAGYEDHCVELRDNIEKYIDQPIKSQVTIDLNDQPCSNLLAIVMAHTKEKFMDQLLLLSAGYVIGGVIGSFFVGRGKAAETAVSMIASAAIYHFMLTGALS